MGPGTLIAEEGEYGTITADIDGVPTPVETLLDPDNTVIYAVENAITQEWAAELIALGRPASIPLGFDRETGAVTYTLRDLAAQAPGTWHESQHFVLNNMAASDTRIPPYGMSYDEALARSALPVPADQYGDPGPGGTYEHWDDVDLTPPPGAHHASVELLYQPTSWEYIQFLHEANTGANTFLQDEGANLLDAWLNTGMAAPHTMASTVWTAPACSDTVDNGGDASAAWPARPWIATTSMHARRTVAIRSQAVSTTRSPTAPTTCPRRRPSARWCWGCGC